MGDDGKENKDEKELVVVKTIKLEHLFARGGSADDLVLDFSSVGKEEENNNNAGASAAFGGAAAGTGADGKKPVAREEIVLKAEEKRNCPTDLKECKDANGFITAIVQRMETSNCTFPACPTIEAALTECGIGDCCETKAELSQCKNHPQCAAVRCRTAAAGEVAATESCPKDAKECPGGNIVVREPRNGCEFTPCPDIDPKLLSMFRTCKRDDCCSSTPDTLYCKDHPQCLYATCEVIEPTKVRKVVASDSKAIRFEGKVEVREVEVQPGSTFEVADKNSEIIIAEKLDIKDGSTLRLTGGFLRAKTEKEEKADVAKTAAANDNNNASSATTAAYKPPEVSLGGVLRLEGDESKGLSAKVDFKRGAKVEWVGKGALVLGADSAIEVAKGADFDMDGGAKIEQLGGADADGKTKTGGIKLDGNMNARGGKKLAPLPNVTANVDAADRPPSLSEFEQSEIDAPVSLGPSGRLNVSQGALKIKSLTSAGAIDVDKAGPIAYSNHHHN